MDTLFEMFPCMDREVVQSVWDNLPEETYAAKIDKCVNALVDMGPLDEAESSNAPARIPRVLGRIAAAVQNGAPVSGVERDQQRELAPQRDRDLEPAVPLSQLVRAPLMMQPRAAPPWEQKEQQQRKEREREHYRERERERDRQRQRDHERERHERCRQEDPKNWAMARLHRTADVAAVRCSKKVEEASARYKLELQLQNSGEQCARVMLELMEQSLRNDLQLAAVANGWQFRAWGHKDLPAGQLLLNSATQNGSLRDEVAQHKARVNKLEVRLSQREKAAAHTLRKLIVAQQRVSELEGECKQLQKKLQDAQQQNLQQQKESHSLLDAKDAEMQEAIPQAAPRCRSATAEDAPADLLEPCSPVSVDLRSDGVAEPEVPCAAVGLSNQELMEALAQTRACCRQAEERRVAAEAAQAQMQVQLLSSKEQQSRRACDLEEQILWGQTLSDIHCVVVQQLRLPQARPAEAQARGRPQRNPPPPSKRQRSDDDHDLAPAKRARPDDSDDTDVDTDDDSYDQPTRVTRSLALFAYVALILDLNGPDREALQYLYQQRFSPVLWQACIDRQRNRDPRWDFSAATSMGLKENGELVAAATFREHQSPRFLEVVAFATHKLHHRQGKGRLLAALLNEWAQSQNYPRILVRSDISVKDFYLAVGYSFFEVKSCSFPALASYFPRKCIVLEGTVGLQFIIPKQRTNFVRPCLQKLRRRSSFCWDSSVAGLSKRAQITVDANGK